jgi:hypothetical protein
LDCGKVTVVLAKVVQLNHVAWKMVNEETKKQARW